MIRKISRLARTIAEKGKTKIRRVVIRADERLNAKRRRYYYGQEIFKERMDRINCPRTSHVDFSGIGRRFLTGFKHSFYKGQRAFLVDLKESNYESVISVAIMVGERTLKRNSHSNKPLFEAKLGFGRDPNGKKVVYIEALQGTKGITPHLRDFENAVGMPAPNFLVAEIEAQAKALGYDKVGFVDVHQLDWYQHPAITDLKITTFEDFLKKNKGMPQTELRKKYREIREEEVRATQVKRDKIRKRMEKLYNNVAQTMGYKRETKVGKFFFKEL